MTRSTWAAIELFAQDAGLERPDEIVGRTDHELGWRDQADLYRTDDREVMASGVPKIGYEEPQTTPNGRRIWLRTSKIPLRNADGEIVGVLGTYEDITASKDAEEERRHLEANVLHAQKLESLGILAGGIAHDFNNLLVAVLGHADLALAETPPHAPGRQHLEEIRKAAVRASELTNQMLAYSGRGRFRVQRLDLSAVVDEISHLLLASIPKKTILHCELADDLPAVEADVAQINQVVMNLVTNAAESFEDGGTITLRTGRLVAGPAEYMDATTHESLPAGDYVFLEVRDDGCGMSDETRQRLFEPFFTTKFQGRGLGLAAVMGIVHGHGGLIEVVSAPDQGSTFRVLLPADLSRRAADEDVDTADRAQAPFHGTVLLVDDEETVRRTVGKMLEYEGFDVLVARDGIEALRVFNERRREIRLVLLDITMPRMDGLEAFRELRAIDPNVRVLLASGFDEQEATRQLEDPGQAGFIKKPFTRDALRARLGKVLA